MSRPELTEDQKKAVLSRDTAILVSAAAGSGKTSVLTQRLLTRICEGENVDRFLVITFTRAAAAELRARILKGLNEIAAAQPDNTHIRRQTALLYRAQIGTIDSFCTAVVRENAHIKGISPTFSMADEDRARTMLLKSAADVLERAYEHLDDNAGMRLLADSVGAGRDDSRLQEYVLDIYDRMQSRADPRAWAEKALAMLDAEGLTDAGQTVWGQALLDSAAVSARSCELRLERACDELAACGEKKLIDAYIPNLEETADIFRAIETAAKTGWDALRAALDVKFPRLPAPRGIENGAAKDAAKAVRTACGKKLEKLQKRFVTDSETVLRDIRRSAPAMRALMGLVWALDEDYAARKRRADLCDFSDVEHFCVEMLCTEDGGPTDLARTLSERFAEVMVDEYQDVNAVQECIFTRVSDEGRKLFMVGDVKQSIYRFRLAEPTIFNAKYASFADNENGLRVLLRANFRSRASVLEACNSVFEKIMSPALGDIDYNDEARLVPKAVYPAEGEAKPELCVMLPPVDADGRKIITAKEFEARYVAARIREMLDSGIQVYDNGTLRPVRRGDIAVLLRTPTNSAAPYHKALLDQGIPAVMDRGESFLMLPEVSFALSMLSVADNPRQDIPLAAALRGAPFAFEPDELARIRAEARDGDLWDALRSRADADERCGAFIALVSELRDAAADEPMQALLQRLYNRTGLIAYCAALPDGDEHVAGLMRLYDYACRFEKTETRGLNRFTAWLEMLEERGMKQVSAVNPDSVRIMSIHKSKGLEFPVVFLADCSHGFRQESTGQVVCHTDLGLGMKLTDASRGVSWPTLVWNAIAARQQTEMLSEQERVLYVAMTRAKERLIMTCAPTSEKQLDELELLYSGRPGPIDPEELNSAHSAADWLLRAALCDNGETIDIRWITDLPEAPKPAELPKVAHGEDAPEESLAERLAWRYPFEKAVPLPSKLTATELKEHTEYTQVLTEEEAEAADLLPPREHIFRLPDPVGGERPLTGPERGTAAHLVMQYIDPARTNTEIEILSEIERLRAGGLLDDRQAAAVSPADILAYFRSPIGREAAAAPELHREFRFSLLCPASLWYPESGDEEILLQGVIDCWFETEDGITVLDFKTDGQIVPEYYTAQVMAYAAALRRITGRPVTRAVLWYLRRRRAAEIPLEEKFQ